LSKIRFWPRDTFRPKIPLVFAKQQDKGKGDTSELVGFDASFDEFACAISILPKN
jgi:hypothetical protein